MKEKIRQKYANTQEKEKKYYKDFNLNSWNIKFHLAVLFGNTSTISWISF